MAHQTHALPWNTLASNYKYMLSYNHWPLPHYKEIRLLGKENEAKEIAYFCRAFAKQIQEFGVSEREKYDSQEHYQKGARTWKKSIPPQESEADGEGNVQQAPKRGGKNQIETRMVHPEPIFQRYFVQQEDDSNEDYYLPFVDTSTKSIERWFDDEYAPDAGIGDSLKVLMMEASATAPALSAMPTSEIARQELMRQSMDTMLLMANHPQISLQRLQHMHYGHHFGVSRVAEEALKAYLYLNRLVAMRESGSDVCDPVDGTLSAVHRNYHDLPSYHRMLSSVTGTYDGDAQNLVHREFFFSKPKFEDDRAIVYDEDTPNKDVVADMEALNTYLKGIWRIMVTYDVIIREAGADPDWEQMCEDFLTFF